ncbi:MAG TPA: VIT domain-containing protein, partial [Allosphingosinicella sp.]
MAASSEYLVRFALALLLAFGPAGWSAARAAPEPAGNPALTARVNGVNSAAATSRALRIERLELDVKLHGSIAQTIVTAQFANPGSETLEGNFMLALPAGSVVTGYALDVRGAMADGVLVDQRQGRLAYEARVRAGIDPGLAEVSRDNVFSTRIFPIPPRGGRTIRLRFATPLDPEDGYVLPLRSGDAVGQVALSIEASGIAAAPRLRLPAGLSA